MKRFKSIVIAGLSVLVFAAAVLPAASASAQSSAALSIVPKKNYVIEPGKSIKDTLTIRNLDSEKTLELTLRVVDFSYTDDGGTPKLMLAEDAPQTTWSLKPYLTIPKSVSIAPNGTKTLNISASIPAKLGAGSYYSAILYAAGSADGGNVGLSASGVTLAFVSVPGDVKEDLTLEHFGAYNPPTTTDKGGYMFITEAKPRFIAYTLKNEGNVTESPVGSITLKNMFGQEQNIDNINPNSSLALIGQTRTFSTCIKLASEEVEFNGGTTQSRSCVEPDLWPGLYTATLDLYYGQNGNNTQEINHTTHFWYLPWWFVIAFILVLAAATYGIWRLVQKIKGRNFANQRRKLSRRRK
ncbi:MAG: hypothetical protein JWO54_255 [Candidatus Saccharibacteria bacterium]|jgi:hypothetical protein|nr:hypothetical protein [Candidatus Saccharibacteria bacterium]MDB5180497.1 hypothetical protein [Candidatus Saccharibacteria bacterium]